VYDTTGLHTIDSYEEFYESVKKLDVSLEAHGPRSVNMKARLLAARFKEVRAAILQSESDAPVDVRRTKKSILQSDPEILRLIYCHDQVLKFERQSQFWLKKQEVGFFSSSETFIAMRPKGKSRVVMVDFPQIWLPKAPRYLARMGNQLSGSCANKSAGYLMTTIANCPDVLGELPSTELEALLMDISQGLIARYLGLPAPRGLPKRTVRLVAEALMPLPNAPLTREALAACIGISTSTLAKAFSPGESVMAYKKRILEERRNAALPDDAARRRETSHDGTD
jgi:AraC-like DNA-binding protein